MSNKIILSLSYRTLRPLLGESQSKIRRKYMITKEKKAQIIKDYALKEGDTGSPEVQIAILTARINELIGRLGLRK